MFTLLERNGAGKTTFLRIATTQLLPTSGSLTVFGLDVKDDAKQIRRRIAITPQEAKPLWSLNAYDDVVLSLMMWESHSEASLKAKSVLKTIDLKEFEGVHSEELSGGLRQRILIAMTISTKADLMFLDEPTIGLDPLGRRKVWNELIRLKKEEGKTIVLTTHYMDEAEALSDELAIIDKGRVLMEGTPATVRSRYPNSRIKVEVAVGFSTQELESYGRVTKAGNLSRIFVDEKLAEEISQEALRRKAAISISPISLDHVFVELVGSSIDEEEEGAEGSLAPEQGRLREMTQTFAGSIRTKLRTIGAMSYYLGVLPMIRIPFLLPFVFATPFSILFILFVTGRGAALSYGLAGAITMTVSQQGLLLGADLTNFKIEHKFQSMVVVSPVSPFTMFSVALSGLAFRALAARGVARPGGLYHQRDRSIRDFADPGGDNPHMDHDKLDRFLPRPTCSTRAYCLPDRLLHLDPAVESFRPFYPLQIVPAQFRWIAELAATTHSSVLIQNAVYLPSTASQVLTSWVALPAFTIVFLLLALFKARWREN